MLGARVAEFKGQLHGLSIDKADLELEAYEEEVVQIANECAQYIGSDVRLARQDIKVIYGYTGEGYGIVSNLEREAIRLMARCEGIILDPLCVRAAGVIAAELDSLSQRKLAREINRVRLAAHVALP